MQSQVRMLRILHLAIVASQIIFVGVVVGLSDVFELKFNFEEDILVIIIPVFMLIFIVIANLIFRKLLEMARLEQDNNSKFAKYRAASIVRFALMEAPTLLSCVLFFMSDNLLYILCAGLMIIIQLFFHPTKERIAADLVMDMHILND
ncbi:MAG: hypothetical protein IPM74_03385 [Crocinitomicaceae bacterium]|nr:hypothetical protein [Crocinitomicaceae bacterium]MBK8924956.1 hypothetical protein [Crocinitomicaceae bacterium]